LVEVNFEDLTVYLVWVVETAFTVKGLTRSIFVVVVVFGHVGCMSGGAGGEPSGSGF
jgi:hypothetical protein